jgi:hypothetical protein
VESSVRRPSPSDTYSYVREENSGLTRKFVKHYLLFTCITQPNSCTAPVEHGWAGGTFLRLFLTVDVEVAVEPLPLLLHIFFHFPILTVGGSGAGLSTGSYNSSGLFSSPVSHCSRLNISQSS